MESDIRYYRRRAHEEMAAASRAVTESARERRMQLVDLYVRHLKALNEPNPFDDRDYARITGLAKPAFTWPGTVAAHRP